MPRNRAEYKGKYKIPAEDFYTAYWYAFRYPEAKRRVELDRQGDLEVRGLHGIAYDGDHVQAAPHDSAVELEAIARANRSIRDRTIVENVERAAREASEGAGDTFERFLLYGVTTRGATYKYLRDVTGIPAGKDMYYSRRRRFYWHLLQRIG